MSEGNMSKENMEKLAVLQQEHINKLLDQLTWLSARSETQRDALHLVDAYVDYAFKATESPEPFETWVRSRMAIAPHMVIF